ncbi:hypothetical protein RN001_015160 [Aquatica leii]|uniref:Uncharacterized protein n=1 Tax=Aquatica leii TaxID=1421715 RepID=A0AAN7P0M5_9COLE|nr:hypothetical protein RN001_015160 [Aquatica leii]
MVTPSTSFAQVATAPARIPIQAVQAIGPEIKNIDVKELERELLPRLIDALKAVFALRKDSTEEVTSTKLTLDINRENKKRKDDQRTPPEEKGIEGSKPSFSQQKDTNMAKKPRGWPKGAIIDQLEPVLKEIFSDTKICQGINIKRTKTTKIIKNVLCKKETDDLVQQLRAQPFSIHVDESTDITDYKSLAVLVRYQHNFRVEAKLLELVELDATKIYEKFSQSLEKHGVPLKNIVTMQAVTNTETDTLLKCNRFAVRIKPWQPEVYRTKSEDDLPPTETTRHKEKPFATEHQVTACTEKLASLTTDEILPPASPIRSSLDEILMSSPIGLPKTPETPEHWKKPSHPHQPTPTTKDVNVDISLPVY